MLINRALMKAPAPPPPGSIENGVAYNINIDEKAKIISTYNALVYTLDDSRKWKPLMDDYVTIYCIDRSNEDVLNRYHVSFVGQRKKILEIKISSRTKAKIKDSFVRWHDENTTIGARFTKSDVAEKFHKELLEIVTELTPYAKVNKKVALQQRNSMDEHPPLSPELPPSPTSLSQEKDIMVLNIHISETGRKTVFKATTDMTLNDVLRTVCDTEKLDSKNFTFQYQESKKEPLSLNTFADDLKNKNLSLVSTENRNKKPKLDKKSANQSTGKFSSFFSRSKSESIITPSPEQNEFQLNVNDPVWNTFLRLANLHTEELSNARIVSTVESFVMERGGYVYLRQVNDQKLSPQLVDDLNVLAGQLHGLGHSPSPDLSQQSSKPASPTEECSSPTTEDLVSSPASVGVSTLDRRKKKKRAPQPPGEMKKTVSMDSLGESPYAPTPGVTSKGKAAELGVKSDGTPHGKRRAPAIPENLIKTVEDPDSDEKKPPPIFFAPPPPHEPPPDTPSSPVGPLSPNTELGRPITVDTDAAIKLETKFSSGIDETDNKADCNTTSKGAEEDELLVDLDAMLDAEEREIEVKGEETVEVKVEQLEEAENVKEIVIKSNEDDVDVNNNREETVPDKADQDKDIISGVKSRAEKKEPDVAKKEPVPVDGKVGIMSDAKADVLNRNLLFEKVETPSENIPAPSPSSDQTVTNQVNELQNLLSVAENVQNTQQQQMLQQQLLQLQLQVLQQQQLMIAAGFPANSAVGFQPPMVQQPTMTSGNPPANVSQGNSLNSSSPLAAMNGSLIGVVSTGVSSSLPLHPTVTTTQPSSVVQTTMHTPSAAVESQQTSIVETRAPRPVSAIVNVEKKSTESPAAAVRGRTYSQPIVPKKPPSGLYAKLKAKTAAAQPPSKLETKSAIAKVTPPDVEEKPITITQPILTEDKPSVGVKTKKILVTGLINEPVSASETKLGENNLADFSDTKNEGKVEVTSKASEESTPIDLHHPTALTAVVSQNTDHEGKYTDDQKRTVKPLELNRDLQEVKLVVEPTFDATVEPLVKNELDRTTEPSHMHEVKPSVEPVKYELDRNDKSPLKQDTVLADLVNDELRHSVEPVSIECEVTKESISKHVTERDELKAFAQNRLTVEAKTMEIVVSETKVNSQTVESESEPVMNLKNESNVEVSGVRSDLNDDQSKNKVMTEPHLLSEAKDLPDDIDLRPILEVKSINFVESASPAFKETHSEVTNDVQKNKGYNSTAVVKFPDENVAEKNSHDPNGAVVFPDQPKKSEGYEAESVVVFPDENKNFVQTKYIPELNGSFKFSDEKIKPGTSNSLTSPKKNQDNGVKPLGYRPAFTSSSVSATQSAAKSQNDRNVQNIHAGYKYGTNAAKTSSANGQVTSSTQVSKPPGAMQEPTKESPRDSLIKNIEEFGTPDVQADKTNRKLGPNSQEKAPIQQNGTKVYNSYNTNSSYTFDLSSRDVRDTGDGSSKTQTLPKKRAYNIPVKKEYIYDASSILQPKQSASLDRKPPPSVKPKPQKQNSSKTESGNRASFERAVSEDPNLRKTNPSGAVVNPQLSPVTDVSQDQEHNIKPSDIFRARELAKKEPPKVQPKSKLCKSFSNVEQFEHNVKPSELFGVSKTLPRQQKQKSLHVDKDIDFRSSNASRD